MSASILNHPCFKDGKGYPYPSHVCAPNVVTVKLSGGGHNYNAWKTQMLCLLVSHNMIGFINGKLVSPQGKVGDVEAWIRSDALAKSWILGCLSEEATIYVVNRLVSGMENADFTAKDAWDEVESLYGPGGVLQQAIETKGKIGKAYTEIQGKSVLLDDKSEDEEPKEEEPEEEEPEEEELKEEEPEEEESEKRIKQRKRKNKAKNVCIFDQEIEGKKGNAYTKIQGKSVPVNGELEDEELEGEEPEEEELEGKEPEEEELEGKEPEEEEPEGEEPEEEEPEKRKKQNKRKNKAKNVSIFDQETEGKIGKTFTKIQGKSVPMDDESEEEELEGEELEEGEPEGEEPEGEEPEDEEPEKQKKQRKRKNVAKKVSIFDQETEGKIGKAFTGIQGKSVHVDEEPEEEEPEEEEPEGEEPEGEEPYEEEPEKRKKQRKRKNKAKNVSIFDQDTQGKIGKAFTGLQGKSVPVDEEPEEEESEGEEPEEEEPKGEEPEEEEPEGEEPEKGKKQRKRKNKAKKVSILDQDTQGKIGKAFTGLQGKSVPVDEELEEQEPEGEEPEEEEPEGEEPEEEEPEKRKKQRKRKNKAKNVSIVDQETQGKVGKVGKAFTKIQGKLALVDDESEDEELEGEESEEEEPEGEEPEEEEPKEEEPEKQKEQRERTNKAKNVSIFDQDTEGKIGKAFTKIQGKSVPVDDESKDEEPKKKEPEGKEPEEKEIEEETKGKQKEKEPEDKELEEKTKGKQKKQEKEPEEKELEQKTKGKRKKQMKSGNKSKKNCMCRCLSLSLKTVRIFRCCYRCYQCLC